ncbi:MAG: hydrolase, partial [Bacteroidetes bacterium]|nr:hydrolase [Bacteroidota bacterium]
YIYSDDREPVSFKFGQRVGWDDLQKKFSATEVGIEIRPLGWLQLDLEAEYQRTRDQEAWVENLDLADGTASIFGDRSTDQIDVQARGTLVFTRDLTLQLYGQVFVAKGAYQNFRRLVTPSAFEPYAYSGSPDFVSQSIIGNVVLRWEYRPGSTAYLVWSHAKDSGDAPPDGSLADGVRDAFRLPPANVVLLKVNYWLEF